MNLKDPPLPKGPMGLAFLVWVGLSAAGWALILGAVWIVWKLIGALL